MARQCCGLSAPHENAGEGRAWHGENEENRPVIHSASFAHCFRVDRYWACSSAERGVYYAICLGRILKIKAVASEAGGQAGYQSAKSGVVRAEPPLHAGPYSRAPPLVERVRSTRHPCVELV